MDQKAKVTPKDFFLWVGATIALYGALIAFISLIFSYLDYALPDALTYFTSDPYSGGISYEMASLIVLSVVYTALSFVIVRDAMRDPTRLSVWVRRWAIYLTLFLAGAVVTIDLITLLMYFFNGDTTARFLLKVLTVLLVAGGIFSYEFADLRAYWMREINKARSVRLGAAALIVVIIVAGFFIVGTPWQARLYRFDGQKISDLSEIQSEIGSYWQQHQKLPAALADLNDPMSGFTVPSDPQNGQDYEYSASTTSKTSFELCATFNAPIQPYAVAAMTAPAGPYGQVSDSEIWTHGAGRTCFDRTIDPSAFPPLTQSAQ